jgi:hypothetical protein
MDKVAGIFQRLKVYLGSVQVANTSISIFLCGGAGEESAKFRNRVKFEIIQTKSKYNYRVYYPEDMFIDFLLGHEKYDLLTLENLLANDVTSVAILLDSPGTLTELGAFSNFEKLNDKLIVVIDNKHRKKKSFINMGPVRYLERHTQSRLIYSKLDLDSAKEISRQITEIARNSHQSSNIVADFSNLIWMYDYVVYSIYIFEPLNRDRLENSIGSLATTISEKEKWKINTTSILSSLTSERKISISNNSLRLTEKGRESIFLSKTRRQVGEINKCLSKLRLEALNVTLRRSTFKTWREAIA